MSRRAAHTVAAAEPPCHEHGPAAARDKHTGAAGEELTIRDLLGSASVFAAVLKTLVEEALERVDGTDALSLGQLRFLSLLGAAGPVTLGELAQRLDMTDAAASRQVDHLTRRGLVHRRSGTRDRRTVQISLARRGEAVIAAYDEEIQRTVEWPLGWVHGGAVSDMATRLDRMTRALLDGRGEPLPCRGCLACNMFQRDECPLGHARPDAACHPATH